MESILRVAALLDLSQGGHRPPWPVLYYNPSNGKKLGGKKLNDETENDIDGNGRDYRDLSHRHYQCAGDRSPGLGHHACSVDFQHRPVRSNVENRRAEEHRAAG